MDLNKALRAMNYSDEWRNYVEAAALFQGKEFNSELLAAMTKEHLDSITMNEETQEISVDSEVGERLLDSVEKFEVAEEPVAETPTEEVDNLENRVAFLEQRLESMTETPIFKQEAFNGGK